MPFSLIAVKTHRVLCRLVVAGGIHNTNSPWRPVAVGSLAPYVGITDVISRTMFATIVTKDSTHLAANEHHKQFDLYNWNGLIGVYPGVQGIKIGNTGDAGKTTLVYATRGGKKMVAVVLGAPGTLERDLWAAKLLDYGYEQTLALPRINVTEEQLTAKYSTWQYWN